MQVACRRCGYPVPSEQRECQSCGEDNGFPNVRLAEIPREIAALAQRVRDAEVSSDARNCRDVLERFGTAVQSSQAIIARSLAVIQDLIESDLRTYTSFQRQLAAGMRVAEDNEADRVRTQVEAALYPNFHTEIRFAFLSIGPAGLAAYGAYAMVLKNAMIEHRATVFEENLLTLGKRLRLLLTEPIPAGYRATWARRDSLAKAKLHMMLGTKTADADFPSILVEDNGSTGSDFIEVHVFGPLNRNSIERIIGPTPRTRDDRLIWRRLERQLAQIGVPVETI